MPTLPAGITAEQLELCAEVWERYGELDCPADCPEQGNPDCGSLACPPDPLAAWLRTLADEI